MTFIALIMLSVVFYFIDRESFLSLYDFIKSK